MLNLPSSVLYFHCLNIDKHLLKKNSGEKFKSPLIWTWEVKLDDEIWVQAYTKNKSTITTRVNVTKNEGNLPYMKSSDILVVYV